MENPMKTLPFDSTSPFDSSTTPSVDPYVATLDCSEIADTWETSWESLDHHLMSRSLEISDNEPTLNQNPDLNRDSDDPVPYTDDCPTLVDDFDPPTLVDTYSELELSSKMVDLHRLEWKKGWKAKVENRILLADL